MKHTKTTWLQVFGALGLFASSVTSLAEVSSNYEYQEAAWGRHQMIRIGCASGGESKSINNGHILVPITAYLPSQIFGSLIVDLNDSSTLWW